MVPEPEYVVPPGVPVMVHDPEAGSPLRATLPVDVYKRQTPLLVTEAMVGFELVHTPPEEGVR